MCAVARLIGAAFEEHSVFKKKKKVRLLQIGAPNSAILIGQTSQKQVTRIE